MELRGDVASTVCAAEVQSGGLKRMPDPIAPCNRAAAGQQAESLRRAQAYRQLNSARLLESIRRPERIGPADRGLEQRVLANTVDEEHVTLVRQVLCLKNDIQVVSKVVRGRSIDVQGFLVPLQI